MGYPAIVQLLLQPILSNHIYPLVFRELQYLLEVHSRGVGRAEDLALFHLNAKLVECRLVLSPRLGSVVRDEYEALSYN